MVAATHSQLLTTWILHCTHSMWSRVYVTIWYLSVSLIPRCTVLLRVCCCGPGKQEASITCCLALSSSRTTARHAAANAGSATLSANVGSWTQLVLSKLLLSRTADSDYHGWALCNEYNIMGFSPLIFDVFAKFRAVCESWYSLISCIILDIDLSVCQSVFLHFVFYMSTWVCLQCFDAVGWAAGRASGL